MHTLILDADGRAHRLFWYAGTRTRAAIIGSPTAPLVYTAITFSSDELIALVRRGDIFEATPQESEALQAATLDKLADTLANAPCFATTEAIEAAHELHVEMGREQVDDHYRFASGVLRTRVEHLRGLTRAQVADLRRALANPRLYGVRLRTTTETRQARQRTRPTRTAAAA